MIRHIERNPMQSPSVLINSVDLKSCSIYTVGLWQTFEYPEIITVGVPVHVGQRLLWDMRNLILLGQSPPIGLPLGYGKPFYPIQLEPIGDRNIISTCLPAATQQYQHNYPVLQLFWSHPQGDIAWEQSLLHPDILSQVTDPVAFVTHTR